MSSLHASIWKLRLSSHWRSHGRWMALVVITVVGGLIGTPDAAAQSDQDPADEAAHEIAAAQDRANAAAADFQRTQSELEVLTDEAALLAEEHRSLQSTVASLRIGAEQIAVAQFMAAGSRGIPLLTDYQDPSDQLQARALSEIALDVSAADVDAYETARRELSTSAERLAETTERVEERRKAFERLQSEAEREVDRLCESSSTASKTSRSGPHCRRFAAMNKRARM